MARIGTLGTAKTKFKHRVTLGGRADAGGFGGDERLEIDDVKDGRFNQLGFKYGCPNPDHRLMGKHDRAFRHTPDVAGKVKIPQLAEKRRFKADAFKVLPGPLVKMQVVDVVNQ
jgi:hypothetical protein